MNMVMPLTDQEQTLVCRTNISLFKKAKFVLPAHQKEWKRQRCLTLSRKKERTPNNGADLCVTSKAEARLLYYSENGKVYL